MRRRFVAVDRDGTVIVERHYLSDPAGVELIPGAAEGLRAMQRAGLGLVVLTNQSAIGRGFFNHERLAAIHRQMCDALAEEGVRLDGIYYCPHVPDDGCACRKPRPGLLERAARELDFLPAESFVVGDKACDVDLGRRAGAVTLLVRTGYGAESATDASLAPDHVVDDLEHAARVIMELARPDGRERLLAGRSSS